MTKKRILTIGGATEDIFLDYQQARTMLIDTKQGQRSCLVIPEGTKIEIENLTYTTGGGATNSAVSFERQGFDVATTVKIGDDVQGEFVRQELIAHSINTKTIATDKSKPTALSCILKVPSGNHTLLVYRGANTELTLEDIPFDMFSTLDQLYITSLSGASSELLVPICQKAKELNLPVATNPGSSQLAACSEGLCQALPTLDILILNGDEAKILLHSLMQRDKELQKELRKTTAAQNTSLEAELFKTTTYKDMRFNVQLYFKAMLAKGIRIAVVTNGAEGVYAATENKMYFHKSFPTSVVNTVGAGDSFGSVFVGSLVSDYSLQESLVRGILNAVSVISTENAKGGLLSAQELDTRFKKVGIGGIEEHPLD